MRRRGKGEELSARQIASYVRRKKMLLKKAMELSVLCDCDVALIVFGADGRLVQYSSVDAMDKLLEDYAEACNKPHERYTNADLLKEFHEEVGRYDDNSTASLARKRMNEIDASAPGPGGGGSDLPMSLTTQPIHVEGIKPAGFMDDKNHPVSPRSETAYKEINTQIDRWIEQLNNRGTQESGGMGASGPGGMSPGGAGKRFKSLSVIVPENPSQLILPPAAAAGDTSLPTAQPTSSADGPSTSQDLTALLRQHSQSISGGIMGLSMPSPSNLLFGLPSSSGLFTSRGGLNLDLPMPDSTTSLGRGSLDWSSHSRGNMLPSFSEDNESGEELPGDLMVTGRGIQHSLGEGLEVTSSGGGESSGRGMDGLLMVSGIKVAMPPNKERTGDVEFPGFSGFTQKEATVTPVQGKMGAYSGGIDIPLEL